MREELVKQQREVETKDSEQLDLCSQASNRMEQNILHEIER